MKKLHFLMAAFLCSQSLMAQNPDAAGMATAAVFADITMTTARTVSRTSRRPLFGWSILWSGSFELKPGGEMPAGFTGTLLNRGDVRLHYLPLGIMLRGGVLDRHTLDIDPYNLPGITWGNPDKWITNFTGGLYHRPTGSRFLFGVLDEWGLSARIRNPWIRSPPYAENHRPLTADLKTAVSASKKDEVYLYLSTPLLEIFPGIRLRSFISAQTEIANTERKTSAAETENTEGDIDNTDDHDGTENTGDADEAYSSGGQNQITRHAFSGGLDFAFGRGSRLLFETFYTAATLAPVKASSWFSNPPPLPERDTYLYAAGILFTCPDFSISGDFAFSETFIWGTGIYADIGVNFTPALSFGSRARPLSISLAADGSGGRFINRDGGSLNEGFRSAVKIEWKGRYNFLVRFNTVLRSQAFGENFNRSSTGFYWRFPSSGGIFRITRISLSADRNAANPAKINDSFSAAAGFSINMRQIGIQNPLGIAISGSLKGLDNADWNEIPCPYPIPGGTWRQESASAGCDLYWSPSIFQFRTGFGATWFAEKKEKWDFSISMAIRFGFGRLSIRAASSNLPENWTYTVSWRMEYQ